VTAGGDTIVSATEREIVSWHRPKEANGAWTKEAFVPKESGLLPLSLAAAVTGDGRNRVAAAFQRADQTAPPAHAVATWDASGPGPARPKWLMQAKEVQDVRFAADGSTVLAAYPDVSRISFAVDPPVYGRSAKAGSDEFFTQIATGSVKSKGGRVPAALCYGDGPDAALWSDGLDQLLTRISGGRRDTVLAAAIHPDGEHVAFGFASGRMALIKLSPGNSVESVELLTEQPHSPIAALEFCPSPAYLVAAVVRNGTSHVLRFDEAGGEPRDLFQLNLPGATVLDVTLSPQCKEVVSAWDDGTVRISTTAGDVPPLEGVRPLESLRKDLVVRLGLGQPGP
jgi:WD40 repeat protein